MADGSIAEQIRRRRTFAIISHPNQGIYDLAGAEGKFLGEYHQRLGVLPYSLKRNFRSVPQIVSLANGLCGRDDVAERAAPATLHGAFFTVFKRGQHAQLITAFQNALAVAGAEAKRSAVLAAWPRRYAATRRLLGKVR